jgi:hypothetical protein
MFMTNLEIHFVVIHLIWENRVGRKALTRENYAFQPSLIIRFSSGGIRYRPVTFIPQSSTDIDFLIDEVLRSVVGSHQRQNGACRPTLIHHS